MAHVSPPSDAFDPSSSAPLWAQLEAHLRARLEAGEFGERFPTDQHLVAEYGVSRHTVREAIRHLNRAGVLTRRRGRGGTTINQDAIEQPLGALYSLFESIEASGHVQRSDVLAIRTTTDQIAASHLDLDGSAELFHLERLRWIDDEPLAIDRVWMPLDVAEPLLDADFSHTALYVELERHVGSRPQVGWERIAPIVPASEERRLLEMTRAEAAFFIERSSSIEERLVEWRTTVLRGANYRFVADFRAGRSPALTATATTEH